MEHHQRILFSSKKCTDEGGVELKSSVVTHVKMLYQMISDNSVFTTSQYSFLCLNSLLVKCERGKKVCRISFAYD